MVHFRSERVSTGFGAFSDTRVVGIVNRFVVAVVEVGIAIVRIVFFTAGRIKIFRAIRIPRPGSAAAFLLNRTIKKRVADDHARQPRIIYERPEPDERSIVGNVRVQLPKLGRRDSGITAVSRSCRQELAPLDPARLLLLEIKNTRPNSFQRGDVLHQPVMLEVVVGVEF